MRDIFSGDDDEMEIGDTGFTAASDGWMINKQTGHSRDPEGRLYDPNGELIFDPHDPIEDYSSDDSEEYEWYS